MLGFSKRMVDGIFDDVVDFSEIENFIDTQVKFYSSGMYVRLGFAIAVNVDPDVLVIDEVLAVGDERFQAKCLDRIRTFQEEGRTILFVSHAADQIRAICDRVIVLDSGRMLTDASPGEAVRVFRESLGGAPAADELGAPNRQMRASRNVEILGVDVVGGARVHTGDALHLRVGLRTKEPVAAGLVLEIHKLNGELLVRTDPDAPQHAGISYLLVPMHQAGVDIRPITQVDGSAEFNEVFFTNARCHKDNVIGGVNNGWKVAMTTLGFERGSSSTTGYRRFLKEWELIVEEAVRHNKTGDRRTRDDLVKAWQKVKIMQINGYRSLTDGLNNTHDAALLGACNKMFWSETHRATMELALDVMGMQAQILTGKGESSSPTSLGRRGRADYPVSDLQASFFFSRSETIWGGTAEIQRNIIGERALGLPKEPKAQNI